MVNFVVLNNHFELQQVVRGSSSVFLYQLNNLHFRVVQTNIASIFYTYKTPAVNSKEKVSSCVHVSTK